jgi:hypothetical protein
MSESDKYLNHYNELKREERQRATNMLLDIAPELPVTTRDALVGVISDIAARVKVLEEYLVKVDMRDETFSPGAEVFGSGPQTELKIPIADFTGNHLLGNLKHHEDGTPYRNIPSNTTVLADIHVDRNAEKTLAINVVSSSNDSLLTQVEVKVDGVQTRHRMAIIEGKKRLLVHLAKRSRQHHQKTQLEIKAPALSLDQHISLSDIFVVPKLNMLGFVKKRLFA